MLMGLPGSSRLMRLIVAVPFAMIGVLSVVGGVIRGGALGIIGGLVTLAGAAVMGRRGPSRDPSEEEPIENAGSHLLWLMLGFGLIVGGIVMSGLASQLAYAGQIPWLVGTEP